MSGKPSQIILIDRFFQKVKKTDSCWLWTGCLEKYGYGNIRFDGKCHKSHRLSYEFFVGEIPKGQLVCHRCDVRNCVNPKHLFLGSHKDNTQDMVKKLRFKSKLKPSDIREIRDLVKVFSFTDVGKIYGVTGENISMVAKGKTWIRQ